MSEFELNCKQELRRQAVRAATLNGLDYVEVGEQDQRVLKVYFLGKAPPKFNPKNLPNVLIEGGRRIRDIRVVGLEVHHSKDPRKDDWMTVRVDRAGDFSTYTLCLVEVDKHQQPKKIADKENFRLKYQPLRGFDPRYVCVEFSFKAGCPSDLDCLPRSCPPAPLTEPEINYLAKDYASFRQLILDRLALLMPDWQERHTPDIGMALVELLAYVGDHLSYYQDAVATEAYLDTARQRISVRRHTRLVDYRLHEGCNARAWVWVGVDTNLTGDQALNPSELCFATKPTEPGAAAMTGVAADDINALLLAGSQIFEPVTGQPIELHSDHNEIPFYTWGDRECCLSRGATAASLLDIWLYEAETTEAGAGQTVEQPTTHSHSRECPPLDRTRLKRKLNLQPGDVLIFEEVLGPKTGVKADADPARRHAVRLIRVYPNEDPVITTPFKVNGHTYDLPMPVLEIEWAVEDALPFALCLSSISETDCAYLANVSVARGNVILVDHGFTVRPPEPVGAVPVRSQEAPCDCEGHPGEIALTPGRFDPQLSRTSLTYSQALPKDNPARHRFVPAGRLLEQDPRQAEPRVSLAGIPATPDGKETLFKCDDLTQPGRLVEEWVGSGASPSTHRRGLSLSHRTLMLLKEHKAKGSNAINPELNQALLKDMKAVLEQWTVRLDLFASGPDDRHFVVEIDNDGKAHLRFGDGELGEQPSAGTSFYASYRVGNGTRGNVGPEAISRLVIRGGTYSGVSFSVRNPQPAAGGADAEPMAEAKLYAPATFRKRLERAITADDYAALAEREFQSVQQAAATLAWTGSWYEAEVAVDPRGAIASDSGVSLLKEIKTTLEHYRRIGHDLKVEAAHYVPLDIELVVCVLPDYLRGHVKAVLLDEFSNRVLPDGQLGFFHPDRLTFGEGVYLSKLIATAQALPGVESVRVTRLQRLFEPENGEIENGVLVLGPMEVARLDGDPSYPEFGKLALVMKGGR